MTEPELEELLFEVGQTTTLSRLVRAGKLVFNVNDYRDAWSSDLDLSPPNDIVVRQINYSRHTMPAPFGGAWCIRPGSIQTLRDWDEGGLRDQPT